MMRESRKVQLSGLLVFVSIFISAGAQEGDGKTGFTCEKGSATRAVEVVSGDGFACRVKYSRASGTTFPWSARNEADYCAPRAVGLVEKLTALGWECDSAEDVKSILMAQIERYERYIKILNNVGKTCHFYPTEAQFGNLCGDQRDEAVIVYTCDGDVDSWNQHLAVFLEIEAEPIIKEVGGSDFRQVSSYHINNDRIMMESEKIVHVEGANSTQDFVDKTEIQCRYSDASRWELIEK